MTKTRKQRTEAQLDADIELAMHRGTYSVFMRVIRENKTNPSAGRDVILELDKLGGKKAVMTLTDDLSGKGYRHVSSWGNGFRQLNKLERQALENARNKHRDVMDRKYVADDDVKRDKVFGKEEKKNTFLARSGLAAGTAGIIIGLGGIVDGFSNTLVSADLQREQYSTDPLAMTPKLAYMANIGYYGGMVEGAVGVAALGMGGLLLISGDAFSRQSREQQRKIISHIENAAKEAQQRVDLVVAASAQRSDEFGEELSSYPENKAYQALGVLLAKLTGRELIRYYPPLKPGQFEAPDFHIVLRDPDDAKEVTAIMELLAPLNVPTERSPKYKNIVINTPAEQWVEPLLDILARREQEARRSAAIFTRGEKRPDSPFVDAHELRLLKDEIGKDVSALRPKQPFVGG